MCLANLILQGGLYLSNALMVNNHWVSICMPKRVHYICLVNNLFTFPAWCHDVLVCNFLIYSGFPFRLHAPVHQVVSLPLLPPSPLPPPFDPPLSLPPLLSVRQQRQPPILSPRLQAPTRSLLLLALPATPLQQQQAELVQVAPLASGRWAAGGDRQEGHLTCLQ